MKKQWSTVLIVLLTLLVVIFAVLNVDPVTINFGFTLVSIPLVIVIISMLLIGMLIVVIWSTTLLFRDRREQQKLQKQLDHFEDKTATEREEMTQKHLKEIEALQNQIEKEKAENRDLKRRIQNMQTTQSANQDKSDTELI